MEIGYVAGIVQMPSGTLRCRAQVESRYAFDQNVWSRSLIVGQDNDRQAVFRINGECST